METFLGKKLSKRMLYHALNRVFRGSHSQVFYKKKTIPKSFKKFTRKYVCRSLFLNKLAGLLPTISLSLMYSNFSLNFAKNFTALFSQSTSGRLLLLNILLFTESTSAPKCYTWPVLFF